MFGAQIITFPYIVIATSEEAIKTIQVTVNSSNTNVNITLANRFKVINECDCLPYLSI